MPKIFSPPLAKLADDRGMPGSHAATDQPGRVIHDTVAGSVAPAQQLGWQTALQALTAEGVGHAG